MVGLMRAASLVGLAASLALLYVLGMTDKALMCLPLFLSSLFALASSLGLGPDPVHNPEVHAKSWLTAMGGGLATSLLLFLAGYPDNTWLGFPIFMLAVAVLAYTGFLVKKINGEKGWNLPKEIV